jgi:alpha-L-fucosidase 2
MLEAENPKSQFVFSQESPLPDEPLTLWYRRPATKWETEALPVGKNEEATKLAGDQMMGNSMRVKSYLTLGDLVLELPVATAMTGYRRDLSPSDGEKEKSAPSLGDFASKDCGFTENSKELCGRI